MLLHQTFKACCLVNTARSLENIVSPRIQSVWVDGVLLDIDVLLVSLDLPQPTKLLWWFETRLVVAPRQVVHFQTEASLYYSAIHVQL